MPVWAFEFETSKSPDYLLSVLRGNTGGWDTALSYGGWVRGRRFFVTPRTLRYLNPGTILIGRVKGLEGGSSVSVLLTLHPIVWIVLIPCTWLVIPSAVIVGFAWLFVVAGFAVETAHAERELRWSMGLDAPATSA